MSQSLKGDVAVMITFFFFLIGLLLKPCCLSFFFPEEMGYTISVRDVILGDSGGLSE